MEKLVLTITIIRGGGNEKGCYCMERENGRCINSCVRKGTCDKNGNNSCNKNCYYSRERNE
jgi:hypothetical protein